MFKYTINIVIIKVSSHQTVHMKLKQNSWGNWLLFGIILLLLRGKDLFGSGEATSPQAGNQCFHEIFIPFCGLNSLWD